MTVYRTRELPSGTPRGRLLVPATVIDETLLALRRQKGRDGRHEGLALWAGRAAGADTVILAAVAPRVRSTPGSVHATESEVGKAARAARALGLAILAQVHSHPGDDVRHSEGDDELVLMPFEGMWSVVVARYGQAKRDAKGAMGVHQFQDGRWVWISSPYEALIVVPAVVVP